MTRPDRLLSGTWDLGAKDPIEKRFACLYAKLRTICLPLPVNHIVTEMPFVHAKSGQQSKQSVFGLAAITMMFAVQSGITFSTVVPSAVKRWVAGSGRSPKVDLALELRKRYPEQRFESLDQSDALAILVYYLEKKCEPIPAA